VAAAEGSSRSAMVFEDAMPTRRIPGVKR